MSIFLPLISFVLLCLVVWSLLSFGAFSDFKRLNDETNKDDSNVKNNRTDIVDVYEKRLAELDEQLELKVIEHEQYLSLKADLEIDILNISKNVDEKIKEKQDGFNSQAPRFKYSVLFMVPVAAVVVALFIAQPMTKTVGEWESLKAEYAPSIHDYFVEDKDLPADKQELTGQEFLVLSQNYLQQQPKDSAAWFEIGLLHLKHGSVQQATKFFNNAKSLEPMNKNYTVAYAQALVASDNPVDIQQAVNLVDEIIQESPQHEMAWMTYALANQKLEKFETSVNAWEKLKAIQKSYKEPSPIIEEYLSKAKADLNLSKTAKATVPSRVKEGAKESVNESVNESAQSDSLLDVNVSVDESIASKLSNGVLFVIVKFKDRPMPIAVKRIERAELPVSLAFSDADSLMPTTKLSAGLKGDASKLEVLARYSFKGVAAASPGDYFAPAVSVGDTSINLTINEEVK